MQRREFQDNVGFTCIRNDSTTPKSQLASSDVLILECIFENDGFFWILNYTYFSDKSCSILNGFLKEKNYWLPWTGAIKALYHVHKCYHQLIINGNFKLWNHTEN